MEKNPHLKREQTLSRQLRQAQMLTPNRGRKALRIGPNAPRMTLPAPFTDPKLLPVEPGDVEAEIKVKAKAEVRTWSLWLVA